MILRTTKPSKLIFRCLFIRIIDYSWILNKLPNLKRKCPYIGGSYLPTITDSDIRNFYWQQILSTNSLISGNILASEKMFNFVFVTVLYCSKKKGAKWNKTSN